MATALDTKLVPKVLTLLNKVGTDYTFQVPATLVYDPTTQETTKGSPSDVTIKGSPPLNFRSQMVDGSLVRRDDMQVFIAASGLTFTPVEGMRVANGSLQFNTVSANPIRSGDDVCAWELQLRR